MKSPFGTFGTLGNLLNQQTSRFGATDPDEPEQAPLSWVDEKLKEVNDSFGAAWDKPKTTTTPSPSIVPVAKPTAPKKTLTLVDSINKSLGLTNSKEDDELRERIEIALRPRVSMTGVQSGSSTAPAAPLGTPPTSRPAVPFPAAYPQRPPPAGMGKDISLPVETGRRDTVLPNEMHASLLDAARMGGVEEEAKFQKWYAPIAKKNKLDPNPDAPEHFYDYRAAFKAGAAPGKDGHWPSAFKKDGHPNLVVDGVNTRTGQPVPEQPPPQMFDGVQSGSSSALVRPFGTSGRGTGYTDTPSTRSPLDTAKDVGLDATLGFNSVIDSAVGIADISLASLAGPQFINQPGRVTVGKVLESIGYDSKENKALMQRFFSDKQKEVNLGMEAAGKGISEIDQKRIAERTKELEAGGMMLALARSTATTEVSSSLSLATHGKRAVDIAAYALTNPSVALHSTVQSLPLILAGGAIGRVLGVAGAAAGEVGAISEGMLGASGEAVSSWGVQAEQVRQENPGGAALSPKQMALTGASAIGTGFFSLYGSRIANKFGIADIDTMVAAGASNKAAGHTLIGLAKSIPKAMLQEGLFEEFPQGLQEQVLQNLAQDKPWYEGVADNAILGAFSGALMGGSAQVLEARAHPPTANVQSLRSLLDATKQAREASTFDETVSKSGAPASAPAVPRPLDTPAAFPTPAREPVSRAVEQGMVDASGRPLGATAPTAEAYAAERSTQADRLARVDAAVAAAEAAGDEGEYQRQKAIRIKMAEAFKQTSPLAQQTRDMAAAPNLARDTPAVPVGTTFTTAKGSTYTIAENGGTARDKTASNEKFGPSDRTLYIDEQTAERAQVYLQTHGDADATTTARPQMLEDGSVAIVVKDKETGKVREDLSRTIRGSDHPAVGLHPFEVWNKTDEGERKWHFGNAITAIGEAPSAAPESRPAKPLPTTAATREAIPLPASSLDTPVDPSRLAPKTRWKPTSEYHGNPSLDASTNLQETLDGQRMRLSARQEWQDKLTAELAKPIDHKDPKKRRRPASVEDYKVQIAAATKEIDGFWDDANQHFEGVDLADIRARVEQGEDVRVRRPRRNAIESHALEDALSPEAQAGVSEMFKSWDTQESLRFVRGAMEVYQGLVDIADTEPAAGPLAARLLAGSETYFAARGSAREMSDALHEGIVLITGDPDAGSDSLAEQDTFASAQEAGELVYHTLDPRTASFDIEEFNTAYGQVTWRRDPAKVFPDPKERVNLRTKGGGAEALIPQEEADQRIQSWKDAALEIGKTQDNSKRVIVSLFDRTGVMAQPWVDAGYHVLQWDIRNQTDLTNFGAWMGEIEAAIGEDMTVEGVIAQPPCTSFTNSGNRWWDDQHDKASQEWLEKKYGFKASEEFARPIDYANTLVAVVKLIVAQSNPRFYAMENPLGRIRKQNHLPESTLALDPHNFGDPANKETYIWGEFNPNLPQANVAVETDEDGKERSRTHDLSGSSQKGKDERSVTSMPFAYALFVANHTPAEFAFDTETDEVEDDDAPSAEDLVDESREEAEKVKTIEALTAHADELGAKAEELHAGVETLRGQLQQLTHDRKVMQGHLDKLADPPGATEVEIDDASLTEEELADELLADVMGEPRPARRKKMQQAVDPDAAERAQLKKGIAALTDEMMPVRKAMVAAEKKADAAEKKAAAADTKLEEATAAAATSKPATPRPVEAKKKEEAPKPASKPAESLPIVEGTVAPKPAEKPKQEPASKPFEMTREAFRQDARAAKAPRGTILTAKAEDIKTGEALKGATHPDLKALAIRLNIPRAGTKAKLVERIKAAATVSAFLADADLATLRRYPLADLGKMLKAVSGFATDMGRADRAEALLRWYHDTKRRRQELLADAVHYRYVEKALSTGKAVPEAVLASYPDLVKEAAREKATEETADAAERPDGDVDAEEDGDAGPAGDAAGAEETRVDAHSRQADAYWVADVLPAAREQKYAGTDAQLRTLFDGRVAVARGLLDDMAATDDAHSGAAFIRAILALGGIRPYDLGPSGADLTGAGVRRKLSGDYTNAVQALQKIGYFGSRSPFRENGRATDEIAEALHRNFPDIDPNYGGTIIAKLERIGSGEESIGTEKDIVWALEGAGVRLHEPWWQDFDDSLDFDPEALEAEELSVDPDADPEPAEPERTPAQQEIDKLIAGIKDRNDIVDEPVADVLDTGELQDRLPGAEGARQVGKADTSFRAPQQASGDDYMLGQESTPEAAARAEAEEQATKPGLFEDDAVDTLRQDAELGERDVTAWADKVFSTSENLVAFDVHLNVEGNDRFLHLDTIGTARGTKGAGTRAMEQLTQFADQHGLRVTLSLAESGYTPDEASKTTSSQTRLRAFYGQFGFVSNRGQKKDFTLSPATAMYRDAQAPGTLQQAAEGTVDDSVLYQDDPTEKVPSREDVVAMIKIIDLYLAGGRIPFATAVTRFNSDFGGGFAGKMHTLFEGAWKARTGEGGKKVADVLPKKAAPKPEPANKPATKPATEPESAAKPDNKPATQPDIETPYTAEYAYEQPDGFGNTISYYTVHGGPKGGYDRSSVTADKLTELGIAVPEKTEPATKPKGSDPVKAPAPMSAAHVKLGDSKVGIGQKHYSTLIKDLFAKDPSYLKWLMENGNSRTFLAIADYYRARPDWIAAQNKAAETPAAPDKATPDLPPTTRADAERAITPDAVNVLKGLGITAAATDQGMILLTGKGTYDHQDRIKLLPGTRRGDKRADGRFGGWLVRPDQLSGLVDGSRGSVGHGRRPAVRRASWESHAEYGDLRRRADERPDSSDLPADRSHLLSPRSADLINQGLASGIPQFVLDEQIEDIARIAHAFSRKLPAFLLASEPGSGKTYVLGGAIRELRRQGAKKIVYVTLRKELITQIKADLKAFDIGDVEFVTYSGLRTAKIAPTDALIFDEAHFIKNVKAGGAAVAAAAQGWIKESKFSIFSSATPAENPTELQYLEATGIFKEEFGAFHKFAAAFGATPKRHVSPGGEITHTVEWIPTRMSANDAKAARDWIRKTGAYTSRKIRLPEGQVDSRNVKVVASPEDELRYNQLAAAAEATQHGGGGSNAKMWTVNFQKRLLEAAKVQHGIKEAQNALDRGRYPILFIETKAERIIDIPHLQSQEIAWAQAVALARMARDTKPQRSEFGLPPRGVTDMLAKYMEMSGQSVIEIPSAIEEIQKAFGADQVAVFTGEPQTAAGATKDLAAWRAGTKKIIVATMAKGGTGLSLHDKVGDHQTTQININMPWKATGVVQVAQRSARYGLKGRAEIEWLFADNIAFDRALAKKVGQRMADMSSTVHGEESAGAAEVEDWSFEDDLFAADEIERETNGLKWTGENLATVLQVPRERADLLAELTKYMGLDLASQPGITLMRGGQPADDAMESAPPVDPATAKEIATLKQRIALYQQKDAPAPVIARAQAALKKLEESQPALFEEVRDIENPTPEFARNDEFRLTSEVGKRKSKQDTLFQNPEHVTPAPPFYSRLARAVETAKQEKGNGASWKGAIKGAKAGINAEEYALVSVDDLEDGKSYTKAEVLEYLAANEIKVEPVILGGGTKVGASVPDGAGGLVQATEGGQATHFGQYTEPGADEGSYREVILRTPPRAGTGLKTVEHPSGQGFALLKPDGTYVTNANGLVPSWENEHYLKFGRLQYDESGWVDGHAAYDEHKNPLVRLRFNVRTDANGRKTMFLEEVQPPQAAQQKKMPALFLKNWREIAFKWALRHAAEQGYDAVAWTPGEMQAQRYSLEQQIKSVAWTSEDPNPTNKTFERLRRVDPALAEEFDEHLMLYAGRRITGESRDIEINNAVYLLREGRPTSLNVPVEIAEKLAKIDWPVTKLVGPLVRLTGKTTGGDMSFRVIDGNVQYGTGAARTWNGEPVENVLGKEIAKQIVKTEEGKVEGEGLKIGGEGLKKLYDVDFKNVANNLPALKKNGVKVGTTSLPIAPRRTTAKFVVIQDYAAAPADSPQWNVFRVWNEGRDTEKAAGPFRKRNDAQLAAGEETRKAKLEDKTGTDVPSIPITPALREAVGAGQALFQGNRGGEFYQVSKGAKASVEFLKSGEAIVRALSNPDISSGIHELAHVARRWLFNREVPMAQRAGITDADIETAAKWAGARIQPDGSIQWSWREADGSPNVKAEEKFARGFEKYLYDGKAPIPELQALFDKFASWLREIYQGLMGSSINVDISPEMREVYDHLVTRMMPVKEKTAPTLSERMKADMAARKVVLTGLADKFAKDGYLYGEDRTKPSLTKMLAPSTRAGVKYQVTSFIDGTPVGHRDYQLLGPENDFKSPLDIAVGEFASMDVKPRPKSTPPASRPARTDSIGDQFKEKNAAIAAEAAAAETERDDTSGFTEGMTAPARRNAIEALNKTQGFNGTLLPRKQAIAARVKEGWTVETTPKGERRFSGPTGFFNERDITKTGMDFAAHLIGQKTGDVLAQEREAGQTKPPIDRADYLSQTDYRKQLRATYQNAEGEMASSRLAPQTAAVPAVGTWMIEDDFSSLDGNNIYQLVTLPVENIEISEDSRDRWEDIRRYAQWSKDGKEAPPLTVLQTDKGTLKTLDHRRLLAAKAAGQTEIKAWVSWSTKSDRSGEPIAGLTYELAQKGHEPLPVVAARSAYTIDVEDKRRLLANVFNQDAEGQTETPAFTNPDILYQDDEEGERLYHGSAEMARQGGFKGSLRLDIAPNGRPRVVGDLVDSMGTWWTTSRKDAEKYSESYGTDGRTKVPGVVIEGHVKLANPRVFESAREWMDFVQKFRVKGQPANGAQVKRALQKDGHDGFIVRQGGKGDAMPEGGDFHLSFDNKGVTLAEGFRDTLFQEDEESGSPDTGFWQNRAQKKAQALVDKQPLVVSIDPDVEGAIKAAKGEPKAPWLKGVKEKLGEIAKGGRHFTEINPSASALMATSHEVLLEQERAEHWGQTVAYNRVAEIVKDLTAGQTDTFARALILPDLLKDIENGLYEGKPLPFKYKTVDDIKTDLANVDAMVAKVPALKAALAARAKLVDQLTRDLVKAKLLKPEVLEDTRYYHRRVIEHVTGKDAGLGARGKEVRLRRRGWQRARSGGGDFNTAYHESEFEWLASAYADLKTRGTLTALKSIADISPGLKAEAKTTNITRLGEKMARSMGLTEADPLFGETATTLGREALKPYRQMKAQAIRGILEALYTGNYDVSPRLASVADEIVDAYTEWKDANRKIPVKDRTRFDVNHPRWWDLLKDLAHPDFTSSAALSTRSFFKAIQQQEAHLRTALRHDYVDRLDPKSLAQLAPKGYVTWQPQEGQQFFRATAVDDRLFNAAVNGTRELTAEDRKNVNVVGGQKETWIIPDWLAATLDNFGQSTRAGGFVGAMADLEREVVGRWKQQVLLFPTRLVKYNVNNTTGDADAAAAYSPGIFLHVKGSAAFLHRTMYGKAGLTAADAARQERLTELGVMDAGLSSFEIPELRHLPAFQKLAEDDPQTFMKSLLMLMPRAGKGYWDWAKKVTMYRESILRVAAYDYMLKQVQAGVTVYAASNPARVDVLRTAVAEAKGVPAKAAAQERLAALLSRDLMGDYQAVSVVTQWLRQRNAPFFSFQEVNMKRYFRLFANARREEGSPAGRVGRLAGAVGTGAVRTGIKTVTTAAMSALIVNAFMLAINLINRTLHPDEEEELRKKGRQQMHLIIGRHADNTIWTLRVEGAFSALLSWVNMQNWMSDAVDVYNGHLAVAEVAQDAALAVPNKAFGMADPFTKQLFEQLGGRKFFPNVFDPSPIRDRVSHLASLAAMDWLWDDVTGKPSPPGKWLTRLLFYRTDPGEAAYYDIKSRISKWDVAQGGSGSEARRPDAKANALYYYKRASQWGDAKAVDKWLQRYYDLGGTEKTMTASVKLSSPLGSLSADEQAAFLASLTEREQEIFNMAEDWFANVYGEGAVKHKTPRKAK